MDSQEYLNQISATNRPAQKTSGGFLSSKYFKIIAGSLAAIIVIAIIGAIIGGASGNIKERCFALKLHIDNTSAIISKYQQYVKSPELRSSSASLSGILSNTSRELTDYVTTKYDYKEKSVPKNILEEANTAKDGLESALFEAKINGILDRIYAHKMAYEISLITSSESNIYNSSKDKTLLDILNSSYASLNNLYHNFNDFSEGTK